MSALTRRQAIVAYEEALKAMEGGIPGREFPVRHFLYEGIYYRECFIPAGFVVVGKIHKYPHIVKCAYGAADVLDENGWKVIHPPYVFQSERGIKRVVRARENHSFTTIHNLDRCGVDFIDDPEEMGCRLGALSYDEYDSFLRIL